MRNEARLQVEAYERIKADEAEREAERNTLRRVLDKVNEIYREMDEFDPKRNDDEYHDGYYCAILTLAGWLEDLINGEAV